MHVVVSDYARRGGCVGGKSNAKRGGWVGGKSNAKRGGWVGGKSNAKRGGWVGGRSNAKRGGWVGGRSNAARAGCAVITMPALAKAPIASAVANPIRLFFMVISPTERWEGGVGTEPNEWAH